eukprot:TRINITY_DN13567_c0_g1_i2.p1 TRINITY_DN13567_c0_g1~~TRINITY_DN13567_c0_g1_i2.p1  ORF type:complete len:465 (+),score=104.29 TRINITY_DN13567_c0_g1_i2:143-1537(+)
MQQPTNNLRSGSHAPSTSPHYSLYGSTARSPAVTPRDPTLEPWNVYSQPRSVTSTSPRTSSEPQIAPAGSPRLREYIASNPIFGAPQQSLAQLEDSNSEAVRQAEAIEKEIQELQAARTKMQEDWQREKTELLSAWEQDHKSMLTRLEASGSEEPSSVPQESSPAPPQTAPPHTAPESVLSPSGLEKESIAETPRRRASVDVAPPQPEKRKVVRLTQSITAGPSPTKLLLLLVPRDDLTTASNAARILSACTSQVALVCYPVAGPAVYSEAGSEARIVRSAEIMADTVRPWMPALESNVGLCVLPIHSTNSAVNGLLREAWGAELAMNMAESTVLALRALALRRVALVVSGSQEDANHLVCYLEAHQIQVDSVCALGLGADCEIGRVSAEQMRTVCGDAMRQSRQADGLLVMSSTMCPLEQGLVNQLEAGGKPVVVSQLALVWDMLRRAGVDDVVQGFGKLFVV